MKHFFLFLAASMVLVSCTHKGKIKTELESLHYNGKVKTVIYKIYKAIGDSGKVEKGSLISKVVTECNSAGYFVQQRNYRGEDKLVYQVIRQYDASNNLIKENEAEQAMQYMAPENTMPDSFAITKDSLLLTLDEKGNKAEVRVIENGKPQYRDVNTFDAKGNMIEQKEYAPWDTLNKRETCHYDGNGNLIEKVDFRPNGSMYLRYSYQYDDRNNIIELVTYQNDGKISTKETMKYDEKGNKVADVCSKSDGTIVYDWQYEFTAFDKEGNWIREITDAGGKPQTVVERMIEYYQ